MLNVALPMKFAGRKRCQLCWHWHSELL